MARVAGLPERKLDRSVGDLLEVGAIRSNKPLAVRQGAWLKQSQGWHYDAGLHWAEDDVVITVPPELRARTWVEPLTALEGPEVFS